MSDKKGLGSKFLAIVAKYSGVIVALAITLADGSGVLEFPDLKDGDVPKDGDLGKINGTEADGEVTVLIDEKPVIYVFEKGVFKGVKEQSTEDDPAQMKAENEALKLKLADVTAKYDALAQTHKEAVEEFTALAREVVSGGDFKPTTVIAPKEPAGTESATALVKLEELKKKKLGRK